jgi:hypothetical protein
MTGDRKIALTILPCSLASLAYEVTLTRIFSISLWYHYAFMIISIAMLGLAASGAALSLYPGLRRLERLGLYSLLLGIAIPASHLLANRVPFDPVRLSWEKGELFNIAILYLVIALPFFCTGLVIATPFILRSDRAPLFYGADLLGAGIGSLGILLILGLVTPERAVFLLALPPLAAAATSGSRRLRAVALLCASLSLWLFVQQPEVMRLRLSPYKGLEGALRFPGALLIDSHPSPFARIDTFESPAARFAPGLSLRWLRPLPRQVGLAVDGGDLSAITDVHNRQALGFLEELPAALPYATGRRGRVLIMDPRGGLQLLLARRFHADEVVAVEGQPEIVRVVRNQWRQVTGGIYDGRTFTGLGRSWLRGTAERFDIIDISLTGVEAWGGFGIAEDFRFTVEAIKEYLGHLSPDGLLSVNLYLLPPPRTELRLLATIVTALTEMGVKEPERHLAAVRSWGTLCLLVKRSPLTPAERERIKGFADERWFRLLHWPAMAAREQSSSAGGVGDDYERAFAAILDPSKREAMVAAYPFDIRPVRDDAPFFHYFLRLDRLAEVYGLMGRKWQFFLEEGLIVPVVLAQVAVISLGLLLLPLLPGRGWKVRGRGRWLLPYFALLGFGFMFVETALIQRIILPLETPAVAVATVLTALLVSSGSGSLLGQRLPSLQRPATMAVIPLLVIIYSLCLPGLSTLLAPWPLIVKGVAVILLFFPLGLLMGIPFPVGLRTLGEAEPMLIPWAWVINGCCSVLAPPVAMVVATGSGFSTVLVLGAIAYALAPLNLALLRNAGNG